MLTKNVRAFRNCRITSVYRSQVPRRAIMMHARPPKQSRARTFLISPPPPPDLLFILSHDSAYSTSQQISVNSVSGYWGQTRQTRSPFHSRIKGQPRRRSISALPLYFSRGENLSVTPHVKPTVLRNGLIRRQRISSGKLTTKWAEDCCPGRVLRVQAHGPSHGNIGWFNSGIPLACPAGF